jgi:Icc-related predicted phosphoesterase
MSRIRIVEIDTQPIEVFPYWIVPQGGRDEQGNRRNEQVLLPILKGTVHGLPPGIDALIVASDLQGNVIEGEEVLLLGEKLPEFLSLLIKLEFPRLDTRRIGVMLCGDLFASLGKRGESGKVQQVWRKFKSEFKWVAGVAGNHDYFGTAKEMESFVREEHICFLHRQIKEIDGLQLGGIGGIIGRTDKLNRMEESDYVQALQKLLRQQPHAVLLHQSPDYPEKGYLGEKSIRQVLENASPNLIMCGHCHWETPLVELSNRTQILNADSRVVILCKL